MARAAACSRGSRTMTRISRDLFDLDNATNDRLIGREQSAAGDRDSRARLRVPHYRIVNAAFCHAHPLGSRFNGPERGAWYAAFELETSQAEVAFHKSVELAEVDWFEDEITYDDYLADFSADFHDLRADARFASCLAPSSYVASQDLGATTARRGLARHRLSERPATRGHMRRVLPARAGDERAQGANLSVRLEREGGARDLSALSSSPAPVHPSHERKVARDIGAAAKHQPSDHVSDRRPAAASTSARFSSTMCCSAAASSAVFLPRPH